MNRREALLAYLLARNGGVPKLKLVKEAFLISQDVEMYSFVPYRMGPFSFQLYRDLSKLSERGLVREADNDVEWIGDDVPHVDMVCQGVVDVVVDRFRASSQKELVDHVYAEYPYYTIFSEYDRKIQYKADEKGLTTIGYEGMDIDAFLNKLIENKINMVVDVRNNPFSYKYGFSGGFLRKNLPEFGMIYEHMPEVGIVSSKRKGISTRGEYERLFAEYYRGLGKLENSLKQIQQWARTQKIALLCFEASAECCHRGQIARWMREHGERVEDL